MKRNKFLALLLTFCCAAGMVACSNDDEAVQEGEDSLLREPMTLFRSGKMGYGNQGSGNTENNPGGTAGHYCGVVEGTVNDIQVEWYGIEGCAGYRLKCVVQGRDFEKPTDCLVDTILGPDVLKFRFDDMQYKCGFRFAIQTLSKRGEGFHSKWNGYGDGAHPNDYLQIETGLRYAIPDVFWVENVTKNSLRVCWSLTNRNISADKFELDENGEYVVDKVVVAPTADNPDAPRFEFNFADYKDQGYIDVEGLQDNCSYTVNGFNTNIKRYYDSMYNTLNVRMKGDPIDPIVMKWEDWYDENDINTRAKELKAARIDTMLANYMNNADYPEGTIFELEPKKVYYIQNTVNMSKGFTLRCTDPNVAPEDRPLVYLGIGWQKRVPNPDPVAAVTTPEITAGVSKDQADMGGGYPNPCACNLSFGRNANLGEMGGINVQDIIIENINFDCDGAYNYLNKPEQVGSGLGNYFINQFSQAMAFTLSSFQLRHCNFRHMIRGFIRFQGPNRKQIEHFIIDDCMFYDCGVYDNNGRGYSWITGDGTLPLHNILKDFSWTNSTFIDSPRHAVISENKNTAWDPTVKWNINFSNNTLINCSTRSKDRLIFEMRYAPENMTLTCKNNLFVVVRKDNSDTRNLYTAGMRIEKRGEGTVYHFSDNYAAARPDYTDETMKKADFAGGKGLTDYLWTSYQFSHTSRGANNKAANGGGNQPLNGGDPADETKIKLVEADGKYLTAVDLMEDPNPKSAEGDVDMHSNYRSHKLNLDVEVEHRIPDGFKIKPQYRSLFVNAQGETIGDPRWLK